MIEKTVTSLKRLIWPMTLRFHHHTGNFLRIDRALVEEVSSSGRNTGFIIISYSVPWQSGITTIQQLRLNINQKYCSYEFSRNAYPFERYSQRHAGGCYILTEHDPEHSPQSAAFTIVTRQPSRPSVSTTTQRVVWIDCAIVSFWPVCPIISAE